MASDRGRFAQVKAGATGFSEGVRHVGDLGKVGAGHIRAAWGSMGGNAYGGAFRSGVAEAFGFEYSGVNHGNYRGFLGWKDTPVGQHVLQRDSIQKTARIRRAAMNHRVAPGAGSFARQKVGAQYAGKSIAREMRTMPKGAIRGTLGKMAGRALFPAMTAASMYAGYQRGGILGAAGAAATEAAVLGGFKLAGAVLGTGALWGAGIAAAGGYGYYALGEASRAHVKGLRNLEMGAPVKDPYGTTATLRNRSLQALNSSAVNGRMAMGNEALLMHDSAYSPAFGR